MNTTAINISLQESVKRPILLGYSLSILYLFYYVGTFVGPPAITKLMESFNWNVSMITLAGISIVGSIALLYYVLDHEKQMEG